VKLKAFLVLLNQEADIKPFLHSPIYMYKKLNNLDFYFKVNSPHRWTHVEDHCTAGTWAHHRVKSPWQRVM